MAIKAMITKKLNVFLCLSFGYDEGLGKRVDIPVNFSIRSFLIIFISVSLVTFNALAIEVDNLYTGKILVTDKKLKTRVKAHRWAIEQVLAKVTGNREVLDNSTVQREVRLRTSNYIKSFTFITDEQDRTFLVDEFDQVKIDKLLRSVGASIWGQRRPQTLIWLVVEEGIQRNIVHHEPYPQLSEMILQSCDDRGVPVVLPSKADLESSSIYSSDIWAKFDRVVFKATEPFGVENYVMARMRFVKSDETHPTPGWQLDFQLMAENQVLLKQQVQGEQFEVIRSMSNAIGDYFASQYAIKSEQLGTDEIYLTIAGIEHLVALVKAENYLKSLPPVSAVEMLELYHQTASFKLSLSGEGLDVIKALALLPEFEQILDSDADKPKVKLSVEQQLEKLIQDYYRQIRPISDTEQGDASAGTKQVRLKYNWLGNS